LDVIEEETSREETDYGIEARFAKLREARAKKTHAHGEKAYEDVWEEITQEELDYYKRKWLETSLEERYLTLKKEWYFHESSWYMRRTNGYDGYGCNNDECIPECRCYSKEGRMEDEEVESRYENKRTRNS
jgi:uncharacterized protein YheU (UPF0270 family)